MNWSELYRSLVRWLDGTTSRNRRALKRAREIAAQDAAFRANIAATAGLSEALSAEAVARGPQRYVRVYAGTAGGITLVHSCPDQHGVVELKEPGAWLGWGQGGAVSSFDPSADMDACFAGLEILAVPMAGRGIFRARAWSANERDGMTAPVALRPGATINFWPGRVEVAG